MKKIYLASPYSAKVFYYQKLRFVEVCQIAGNLMKEDPELMVFSPIAHSHPIANYSYGELGLDSKFWIKYNRSWLDWCDELWVADMQGKDESVGIKLEIEHAQAQRKKVVWL